MQRVFFHFIHSWVINWAVMSEIENPSRSVSPGPDPVRDRQNWTDGESSLTRDNAEMFGKWYRPYPTKIPN